MPRIRACKGCSILLTPQAMTDPTETARQLAPFAKIEGKPMLASWMGGADVRAGPDDSGRGRHRHLRLARKPPSRRSCTWSSIAATRSCSTNSPAALPEDWRPDRDRRRAVACTTSRQAGRTLLTEFEAKELLACYGIPAVPTSNAASADEAVAEARKLGYPVVLKLLVGSRSRTRPMRAASC